MPIHLQGDTPGFWEQLRKRRQEVTDWREERAEIKAEKAEAERFEKAEGWTPENILSAWEEGTIDEDLARQLYVQFGMRTDYWNMSPYQIRQAKDLGAITGEQALSVLDRQDQPFWWHTRDLLKGIATGTKDYMENMSKAVGRLSNWLLKRDDDWSFTEAPETPEGLPGQIGSKITEWGLAFGTAGKALQGAGVLGAFLNSAKMGKLAVESPKLATFVRAAVVGGAKGAAADYVSFDPYEGRIADVLHDKGILPEFLLFMCADEDNPEAWERLKNVAEGLFVGTALEAFFLGAKALKATALNKTGGSTEALARMAMEHPDPRISQAFRAGQEKAEQAALVEAKRQREILFRKFADPAETAAEKTREIKFRTFTDAVTPDPGTVPIKDKKYSPKAVSKGVKASEATPEAIFDEVRGKPQPPAQIIEERIAAIATAEAEKKAATAALQDFVRGVDPPREMDQAIAKTIESLDGEVHRLLDIVYKHGEPGMKAARGLGQTHAITQEKAVRMLAEVTGGSAESVLNTARSLFTDVHDVTHKVHAMYKLFAGYTEDLVQMARKYDGSYEQLARLTEHFQVYREFQMMVNGMRSESGRLLDMHKIRVGRARFDFSQIDFANVPDSLKAAKTPWEKLIKEFATQPDLAARAKLARSWGHTLPYWILRYAQANILWGPVTHAVNISSQIGALTYRTLARALVSTGASVAKQDISYLKAFAKEQLGVGHALKVAFEGTASLPTHLRKVMNMRSIEKIPFREAVQRDPNLGTFYKALIGAKGIVDPSIKVDDYIRIQRSLQNSPLAKLGSMTDTALTVPFHLLAGVDEAFKVVGTMSNYYGAVYRDGIKRGLKGAALDKFFNDSIYRGDFPKLRAALDQTEVLTKQQRLQLMEVSRPKTWAESVGVGRELTYQNYLGDGAFGQLQHFLATPAGTAIRVAGAPFYKTLVNLMKYSMRNSPLGVLSGHVRGQLAKGGVEMWEAVTRMAMGGAIMSYAWHKYDSGELTGRLPQDQLTILREAGIQEYAMFNHQKNTWVDYRRSDPFGAMMGIAADLKMAMEIYDLYEEDEELEDKFAELFAAVCMAFVEPTVNATFMRGMKDFLRLVMEPESPGFAEGMQRFSVGLFGRAIPGNTAIKWFHSEFTADEYFREVNTYMDQIWSMINPERLIIRRDPIFGEQVERTERFMHALRQNEMTLDPILLEMVKVGANVEPIRSKLEWEGHSHKITPRERERFYEIYESLKPREGLSRLINSPGYQTIHDMETRADMLRNMIAEYRKVARAIFFGTDPQRVADLRVTLERKQERMLGLRPSVHPSTSLYHFLREDN